jgi:hypothetical protein
MLPKIWQRMLAYFFFQTSHSPVSNLCETHQEAIITVLPNANLHKEQESERRIRCPALLFSNCFLEYRKNLPSNLADISLPL